MEPTRIEGGVPIFEPSWDQFQNFCSYIQRLESYGNAVGIIKIVPPKEWLDKLVQARSLCRAKQGLESSISMNAIDGKENDSRTNFGSNNETFFGFRPLDDLENMVALFEKTKIAKPTQQSFSGENGLYRQLNIEVQRTYNLAQFRKFADSLIRHHRKHSKPDDTGASEYKQLEQLYWKTLPYNEAYYGADLSGSLFPDDFQPWNLQILPCLLRELEIPVLGVNNPYLYIGTWKATFAWHVEDMDLFSINFVHFGAPKQWYSISAQDHQKFEQWMQTSFPEDYGKCPQFLRHKTFVASPSTLLKRAGIQVNKMTQFPGEFMITFPFGYHQGFNYGFNCAEAVNFALPSWIEKGLKAEHCRCISDAVRIHVSSLLDKIMLNARKHNLDESWLSRWRQIQSLSTLKLTLKLSCVCCVCLRTNGDLLKLERTDFYYHMDCHKYITLGRQKTQTAEPIPTSPTEHSLPMNKDCCLCDRLCKNVFYVYCEADKCDRVLHLGCYLRENLFLPSIRLCDVHHPRRIIERKAKYGRKVPPSHISNIDSTSNGRDNHAVTRSVDSSVCLSIGTRVGVHQQGPASIALITALQRHNNDTLYFLKGVGFQGWFTASDFKVI